MFEFLIEPFGVPTTKLFDDCHRTVYRFCVYTVHGTGDYGGLLTVSNGGRSFPDGQIVRRTIGMSGSTIENKNIISL